MSLLNDQLDNKRARKTLLLYGSRTEKDIIFKKQIDAIKEKWFSKVYILSEGKHASKESKYIDKSTIKKHVKDIQNSQFYQSDSHWEFCLSNFSSLRENRLSSRYPRSKQR